MVTTADCTTLGGQYRGLNAVCAQQYCVSASDVWACCFANGSCTAILQQQCWSQHGIYRAGTACAAGLCVALGVCCESSGACYVASESDCAGAPGVYSVTASCNVQFCPRACPCNWNGDRWVNEGDLFRFVNDYMQGHGDFDGDGLTTESDAREFVDCLLHHPAGC
jgi:hypothetical protein